MAEQKENVPTEHVFHFRDGKKAHNLHDLKDLVSKLSEDDFSHHVDEENNDFANWVEFAYKNEELADDLRKITNQKRFVEVLGVYLGEFTGENVTDDPVPEPELAVHKKSSSPHSKPIELTKPPLTLETHDGKVVHSVSPHATHHFITKEFLFGVGFGFLLGVIILAVLFQLGFIPGV